MLSPFVFLVAAGCLVAIPDDQQALSFGRESHAQMQCASLPYGRTHLIVDASDGGKGIQRHALGLDAQLIEQLTLSRPAHANVVRLVELLWCVQRVAAACVGPYEGECDLLHLQTGEGGPASDNRSEPLRVWAQAHLVLCSLLK
eukprot:scaffold663_cov358-Prasinococcus_capsulatus_cf.AAC.3